MLGKLDIIFRSVEYLPKIGDKTAGFLAKLGCRSIIDLIFHLPSNVINIKQYPKAFEIKSGDHVTLKMTITGWDDKPSSRMVRRKPFKIYGKTRDENISLVYFNYYPEFLIKKLQIGDVKIVSGKADRFNYDVQISHPDFVNDEGHIDIPKNEVIYPVTLGLVSRQIRKYIFAALGILPKIDEWIEDDLFQEKAWKSFNKSIEEAHNPSSQNDLLPTAKPRERLGYDELLANQLAIGLMRFYKKKSKGRAFDFDGSLQKQLLEKLGFELTEGQKNALLEIAIDQKSSDKMIRLIQGDVGSGKTLVALCSMLNVLETKANQVCLMVPTDILANQHYNWIKKALENSFINVELLTGKIKGKKRLSIFERLKNSEIQILVGTHALFQEDVEFKDLALIVIDEQHRFGVAQRATLYSKGNNPDLLAMTATPIPRTLALALYGDMDITRITDKPKGRIPIKTSLMSVYKTKELIGSLTKIIENGGLIYWVCPLIEEAENNEQQDNPNAAAITRHKELLLNFKNQVGLVHGKLKSEEKEEEIDKFKNGIYKILVATTVIEVGIDIKDANVIIIEQAEKFGLSQLHQLRGRVGRGSKESFCILLYSKFCSEIAMKKLNILKNTEDGFILAEEDLKLRGAGDIAGLKQSGLPDFKFPDLTIQQELLVLANKNAKKIIQQDPELNSPQGINLRTLLKIFGYKIENLGH